jgi:flagellar basal body rod protein FlgG
MPGGAYSALSGMQTRLDDLDRLASDLANVGTSGYKSERRTTVAADRTSFRSAFDAAVDVTGGGTRLDLSPGTIATTGRDLDAAIEGRGFFVVSTPAGERYTRSGDFVRRADGVLALSDGASVLGTAGEIRIGRGAIAIGEDGTVRAGDVAAGRLRVVDFASESDLVRESGARFRPMPGATPTDSPARVVGGSLEQANVSMVDRMAALTEASRGFEALQRGLAVLLNDIDGRAISELGRR